MKNGEYELVIAPEDYPGKKYRDRYISKHVYIYWKYYGIVPKEDEIIHHIDGNKHNNNIENLILMKRNEHVKLHNHLSQIVELKCPGCGKIFYRKKGDSFLVKKNKCTCCSYRCVGIMTNLSKEEKEKRISENLIRIFKDDVKKYDIK